MPLPAWPPGTVVSLVTLATDGAPHAIPVSAALSQGTTLLLGVARSRGSLERLRGDPRVAVLVLARDVALTVRGRAVVEAEALQGADRVAGVRVAVDAVDDHLRPDVRLEAGVRWAWTRGLSAERDAATLAGLRRLGGELPAPTP